MTIKDIARLSGYAVGTVSRVLNGSPNVSEEARSRIMAVVEEHHFKLNNNAKHLKQQASSGVAIIVKGTQNMLFAAIVEQLQGMIKERGYACLIYYIDEDENEVEQGIQVCQERRPMGIMFLGSKLESFRERFGSIPVPTVMVTNSAASLGFENLSSVSTDDAAAAQLAVEHLIGMGHRQIGILGGRMDSHAAFTRYHGVERAFREKEIPFEPELQFVAARFEMSSGYQAMEKLMVKMPGITAVFAMSDVMALGAIRALKDKGLRVPEDVSVMGYDGLELSNFLTPRLTTIRQHSESIARRSVEILLQGIEEKAQAVHEVIPFDLVPGESAANV